MFLSLKLQICDHLFINFSKQCHKNRVKTNEYKKETNYYLLDFFFGICESYGVYYTIGYISYSKSTL